LLSNIYLHSFDKMFQLAGIPGTRVRYADDCVPRMRERRFDHVLVENH
jgi:hypothetical protein